MLPGAHAICLRDVPLQHDLSGRIAGVHIDIREQPLTDVDLGVGVRLVEPVFVDGVGYQVRDVHVGAGVAVYSVAVPTVAVVPAIGPVPILRVWTGQAAVVIRVSAAGSGVFDPNHFGP